MSRLRASRTHCVPPFYTKSIFQYCFCAVPICDACHSQVQQTHESSERTATIGDCHAGSWTATRWWGRYRWAGPMLPLGPSSSTCARLLPLLTTQRCYALLCRAAARRILPPRPGCAHIDTVPLGVSSARSSGNTAAHCYKNPFDSCSCAA